jgi:hypothetical protein
MRDLSEIMRDLAASGATPEQMALAMELYAAGMAMAPKPIDEAAERRRAKDRERKAKFRGNPQTSAESADPHTPDNTPPNGSPKGEPYCPPKKRRQPKTPLPLGWMPDLNWAVEQGLTLAIAEAEVEQFFDHHRKNASQFADWPAAWRTWVRTNLKWAKERQSRSPPSNVTRLPANQKPRTIFDAIRDRYQDAETG